MEVPILLARDIGIDGRRVSDNSLPHGAADVVNASGHHRLTASHRQRSIDARHMRDSATIDRISMWDERSPGRGEYR